MILKRICNYCKYMSTSTLPTGDRRHARREATRKAILDAAETIVLEDGFEALKSRTLAERAGISERSLFNHFPNLHDVILARVSSYLVRLLDEPSIPARLSAHEIPEALDRKFRESFDRPGADELFARFLALSMRLSPDMLDMLGQHILRTLASVAEQLMEALAENYPSLDFEQGVKIQMYVFNLTTGIAFGLLHGVNRLGILDASRSGPCSTGKARVTQTIQGAEAIDLLTLEVLREDLNWAFAQVANGRPRI